jgi:hypothetical protein
MGNSNDVVFYLQVSTRVPFRPVVGGKPPECSRCCQDELARKRL